MARSMSVHRALALLRQEAVFQEVVLENLEEVLHRATIRLRLDPSLEEPFVASMKEKLKGVSGVVPDDIWIAVSESLIERHVPPALDFFVEFPSFFETDPDAPVLPSLLHLHLDLSGGMRRSVGKKQRVKKATTGDVTLMLRRAEERDRSKTRRAKIRAKKRELGTYEKPGKTSYVQRVEEGDPEFPSWEPTPGGRLVMEAADDVWGKSVGTYPDLVAHLRSLDLKTLDGKTFKTNMMTRLVAQLELLRGSWEPWHHSETTG